MTSRIQVDFAVPVDISAERQQQIWKVVQEICRENQQPGRVHWASGSGSLPLNMDFTDFDDSVFSIQTSERAMYDSEEPR